MTIENLTCPLGITREQLSALLDAMLSVAETQDLQAHCASCPVCQMRLAEYGRLGQSLHSVSVAIDYDALWRSIVRAHEQAARQPKLPQGRVALSLGAVLALALLAIIFVRALPHQSGMRPVTTVPATTAPTFQPTATPGLLPFLKVIKPSGPPIKEPALVWHTYTLPQGYTTVNGNWSAFGIAPSDPHIAYACNTSWVHQEPAQLIVTHDSGADWQVLPPIDKANGLCANVIIDDADPTILMVEYAHVSFDGGATWQISNGLALQRIQHFTSWHGHYFALASTIAANSVTELIESDDQMHTWHRIDQPISGTILNFWLNPNNGAIAVATNNADTYALWLTSDAAQHWQTITVPLAIMIATITNGSSWYFCGLLDDAQQPPNAVAFVCSADDGTTWTELPTMGFSFRYALGSPAVGTDRSLYAFTGLSVNHFFRLQPNTTRWEDFGPISNYITGPSYFPQAGGVLWGFDYTGNHVSTARIP